MIKITLYICYPRKNFSKTQNSKMTQWRYMHIFWEQIIIKLNVTNFNDKIRVNHIGQDVCTLIMKYNNINENYNGFAIVYEKKYLSLYMYRAYKADRLTYNTFSVSY